MEERMASGPSGINEDAVRALAAIAGVPMHEGEAAAVVEVLAAWLPDANELSRKMRRPEYLTVTPATVFGHHPLVDTGEE
jgi:hypothetical protein